MSFFSILDPVFMPLVEYNPTFAVIILALVVSLLTTFTHKYMTNQTVVKHSRAEMKKLQKKMKQHKDNPSKMMEIQSKLLGHNKDVMKESFKPMFITFIPVIIIFGWLNLHLLYEPIMAGDDFTVTAEMEKGALGDVSLFAPDFDNTTALTSGISEREATFSLRASDVLGEYPLVFTYNGANQTHSVLVTDEQTYLNPVGKSSGESPFKEVRVDLDKKYLIDFSFVHLNGFWSYIILTVIFSLLLRKLFGVA